LYTPLCTYGVLEPTYVGKSTMKTGKVVEKKYYFCFEQKHVLLFELLGLYAQKYVSF
jgi:hypothetical protein